MAIDGEGFFVIAKGNERLLTRAGNFSFSPEGRLVTQDGYDVISEDGAPLTIDPTGPAPRVLPDGFIQQGEEGGAAPMLVKPRTLGDLAKTGENRFEALAATAPVTAGERNVKSGYVEQSNVSPTSGMLELIEASRAYEANVRMMQNHDGLLGALLGRVLRP
jgi:flagellar basal-body rod protein FlgF/flagellar basal-body rod protein FlgG